MALNAVLVNIKDRSSAGLSALSGVLWVDTELELEVGTELPITEVYSGNLPIGRTVRIEEREKKDVTVGGYKLPVLNCVLVDPDIS